MESLPVKSCNGNVEHFINNFFDLQPDHVYEVPCYRPYIYIYGINILFIKPTFMWFVLLASLNYFQIDMYFPVQPLCLYTCQAMFSLAKPSFL